MSVSGMDDAVSIEDKSARSVFVGNIPYEVTEERLKDIFSTVGPVLSFKLVFDRDNGKPRGYGFCEFQDPHLARTAINNLNGHEIGGRALRVDSACTEKSRMEMQNLMNSAAATSSNSTYGDPVDPNQAPESISKAVASLPPEQMFELMKQMKICIQNNPDDAKSMLLKNPQLSYALLQALVVMRIINVEMAMTMLHKPVPRAPNFVDPFRKSGPPPVQIPPPTPPGAAAFPNRSFVPPPFGGKPDSFVGSDQPFDSYRGSRDDRGSREGRDEPPQRFNGGRDPRSRDPRADRAGVPPPRNMEGPPPRGPPPSIPPHLATADPARRQLLMQVLQLNDDQIALLPAEQRASIVELKKQINSVPFRN